MDTVEILFRVKDLEAFNSFIQAEIESITKFIDAMDPRQYPIEVDKSITEYFLLDALRVSEIKKGVITLNVNLEDIMALVEIMETYSIYEKLN